MEKKHWEILRFESLVPGQPEDPMVEKEIGPEGGVVELENVARLEIPPGALSNPTKIQIHQVLEVESTREQDGRNAMGLPPGANLPGYDFITPIVRLEPFGLRLNVTATLHLPTDEARVGTNDPGIIRHVASRTAENGDWQFNQYLEPLGPSEREFAATSKSPIKVRYLLYVAKQFSVVWGPTDKAELYFVSTQTELKQED